MTSAASTTLRIALPQIAPVWMNRDATVARFGETIAEAASGGAQLIAFGEGAIPGYPFWIELTGGAQFNAPLQKELFAHYAREAVVIAAGHLDPIRDALRHAGMAGYVGIIERAPDRGGHSLYCAMVYIDPAGVIRSVHRKLVPTYEERLVWSPGDGQGLRTHTLGAFTIGGLNCWENWMPLARAALSAQGEDIHVALWPGSVRNTGDITRFMAMEGRSYCLSVGSLMARDDIDAGMPHAATLRDAFPPALADGGGCLAGPDGAWVLAPLARPTGLRYADIDHRRVFEERQNFDPVGHYSRPDILSLVVDRRRQTVARFADEADSGDGSGATNASVSNP